MDKERKAISHSTLIGCLLFPCFLLVMIGHTPHAFIYPVELKVQMKKKNSLSKMTLLCIFANTDKDFKLTLATLATFRPILFLTGHLFNLNKLLGF